MPLDPEAVCRRLGDHLNRADSRVTAKCFPGYITIRVQDEESHFWSPKLHLSLDATDDGGTVIHGTYGPNADVWALFLYGWLIIGTLGVLAAIFGIAQHLTGHHPWGYWLLGLSLAGAAALYIAAQMGQKLGARQTYLIHQAFEDAIGERVEIR